MKKNFWSILFAFGFVFILNHAVFAENFTYKVYNPKLNKTYNAVLGTVTITENQYIWGFYTKEGKPLCVASLNTNKNSQGLVGSQCTDTYAFMRLMNGELKPNDMSKYEWGWRELSTDTFYRELDAIKQERAFQGKYEYQ